MKKHVYILGQSNYAVGILLDTLVWQYPGLDLSADIIANIPPEQNDSLPWPYETPGVTTREIGWETWRPEPGIPCLIGSIGRSRGAVVQFFQEKFNISAEQYADTVHPSAVVAATVQLGRGLHISPGVVVAPYAGLGDFVVLNRQCSIGHHTVLSDLVTINPGVTIAGLCRIGRRVVIGAGATVLDQVSIGEGSVIGAGSLVTKDIPAGVVAYGVPRKWFGKLAETRAIFLSFEQKNPLICVMLARAKIAKKNAINNSFITNRRARWPVSDSLA